MALHRRVAVVQQASNDLNATLWEWMNRHDLTYIEALRCMLDESHKVAGFALQQERHPDDPEVSSREE